MGRRWRRRRVAVSTCDAVSLGLFHAAFVGCSFDASPVILRQCDDAFFPTTGLFSSSGALVVLLQLLQKASAAEALPNLFPFVASVVIAGSFAAECRQEQR